MYLGNQTETTFLVGDIDEMTDGQRLSFQRRLGLPKNKPLRTLEDWRVALARGPTS